MIHNTQACLAIDHIAFLYWEWLPDSHPVENCLKERTSMPIALRFSFVLAILLGLLCSLNATAKGPAYTRPKEAAAKDPDFKLQGEYAGNVADQVDVGVQVIALGGGKFQAISFLGGLPGDGWDGNHTEPIDGVKKDGAIVFESDEGAGVLKDGKMTIMHNCDEVGVLEKKNRKSTTLRAKPPEGAIVLFDGSGNEKFTDAAMDKKMLAFDPKGKGATSKQKFGSHEIHIEFRLPFMPEARGQGRGNSGLYLQGRYEVQMLDSFGLTGKDNECGGIYKISKPQKNMCYPPLTWQTYDVDFTAAKYDDAGKLVKNPKMTVKHNGVIIHRDLELPHHTTAAPVKAGPEDGPVYLQNHGNPVRYRNIWVVPKS